LYLVSGAGRNPCSSWSDALDVARAIIDGLDLFDHHHAGHVLTFGNRDVEGIVAPGVGHWANDTQSRVLVEEVVADHQGGATPALLVTRLGIKGQRYEELKLIPKNAE
jgi:hypothetical protein